MEVKAPAVLKLLGEHAVVYGKPFVAVTIALKATAKVTDSTNQNEFSVELKDFGKSYALDEKTLKMVYEKYKAKKDINEFLQNPVVDIGMLPYAVVAARMSIECNVKILGKTVIINSDIPMQSGCASSAACYTAFAVALARLAPAYPKDEVVVDIARDGERITHKNEGAGRIDVNPSYYGGVVSYAQNAGVKKETGIKPFEIIVINTGPKKSTAEMVGLVAAQYKRDKEKTENILNEIEKCTLSGLDALKNGNMEDLGKEMLKNHEFLKSFGVSTDGLDKAVALAVQNGAYGAKLSGGGGGGIAIAIAPDPKKIIEAMKTLGFAAFSAQLSNDGAASSI